MVREFRTIQREKKPNRPLFSHNIKDARPEGVLQKRLINKVIQLKSQAAIKQELLVGGYLSNFSAGFVENHIGLGINGPLTNMKAARVHAARAAPPANNTLFMDARDLKTKLSNGAWADPGGNHYVVTTNGNTDRQTTRRLGNAIQAAPVASAQLNITGNGAHADHFTVDNGAITAITGASAAEVQAATASKGAYPSNGAKEKKRAYRQSLIDYINQARRTADSQAGAAWIQANFSQIGATAIDATFTTEALVNAIAAANVATTVHIGKNTGDIFHLHA